MTLQTLALDELKQVTVTISAPGGFPDGVWNAGEYAFMTVTVNNTSGVLLRDVVAYFRGYSGVSVAPITIWGWTIYDGDEYWDELEAGDSRSFTARLYANWAGAGHTCVKLSAEVVPYAIRYHAAVRDPLITPS